MPDKPRLLVADDSENVRREMLAILEDEYELIQAEDGEQAWTAIREDRSINAVFADLTMPGLDGLTLLKRIRADKDEQVRTLPVVMMTDAGDDLRIVKESLASGVTDLVRKPFIPELLRARAGANLRSRREETYVATATVDPLTQLANEPYFMLRGANNLSYAIRHKGHFGLMLIRVDRFDEMCREHEPYVTESVQVKLGNYISAAVRSEDTVARLADGEFGVLLQGADARGVLDTAVRIQQKVKKKIFRYNDQRFTITLSMGVAAPALKPYTSFELILRQARSELTRAVETGGNHIGASNVYQRLAGREERSHYVPTLEEALEMLANNQGKLLEHCAEELFARLLPLLLFCNEKMQLDLVAQIREHLQARGADID